MGYSIKYSPQYDEIFNVMQNLSQFLILNLFFQVLILLNGHAYFWNLSRSALLALSLPADSEIVRSMVFTVILSTFSTLVDMPFTVYYTFWLEERHGFNKQVWITDNYKYDKNEPLVNYLLYLIS
jgi:ABC-type sulfate transport system permease component